MPEDLPARFDFLGGVEECLERLDEEAAAGIDLHQVSITEEDPERWADTLRRLVG